MVERRSHEQHLVRGEAGTLVTYLPGSARAPASATVRFETPTHPLPVVGAGVAATIDTFAADLAAAVEAGDDALPIYRTAGAQTAGRLYTLATPGGVPFLVECAKTRLAVEDDDVFRTREPLPRAFPLDQTTIRGAAITIALSAADTDELGRCRAIFDATLDGVAYSWAVDFRIIPRVVAYQLTGAELTRLSPYAARFLAANDADGDEAVGAAWDRHLVPFMLARGLRPERIASWEQIRPWHLAAVEHHLAEAFESDADRREEKKLALRSAETLALASSTLWVDDGDDLAVPGDGQTRDYSTHFVTR